MLMRPGETASSIAPFDAGALHQRHGNWPRAPSLWVIGSCVPHFIEFPGADVCVERSGGAVEYGRLLLPLDTLNLEMNYFTV